MPPCLWRDTCSWLLRTVSRKLLSNPKDRDATTSLGNLCQCLVTFTVKKCFLTFIGIHLCCSLWPFFLSLDTTGKSLVPPSLLGLVHSDKILTLSVLSSTFISPSPLTLNSNEKYSSLSSSLWFFIGLSPVCVLHMILSYTSKSKAGPRAPDQCWTEQKDHLPQLAANSPPKAA